MGLAEGLQNEASTPPGCKVGLAGTLSVWIARMPADAGTTPDYLLNLAYRNLDTVPWRAGCMDLVFKVVLVKTPIGGGVVPEL